MSIKSILCSALCLLSIVACHHNHGDEDDATNPVLTITAPTSDISITGVVNITGSVTDESLHEMSIIVTKDSDSSELFKAEPKVHDATSYAIAESWSPAGLTAETPVTLTVTAEDHGSNKVIRTIKFKVKS